MSERPGFGDIPDFAEIPDPAEPLRASLPPPRDLRIDADSPDRAKTRKQRLAALALSTAWLGAHLVAYGVRSDLGALPLLYLGVEVALPFVLAAASLFVALEPGRHGLGVRASIISALAVLAPLSFWLMALGAPLPRTPGAGDDGSLLGVLVCLDITLAWAAVPLLCAVLCLRGAFPAVSSFRSALVGGACGLLAGSVMNLHCANVDRVHMTFGHGVPVLVAVLAGAWLMSRTARS